MSEEANNSVFEEDDNIKGSAVGEKESLTPRQRKGRKENMWNDNLNSTTLASKNVSLAAACDLVPVSPKMTSAAVTATCRTPRKTLERSLHEMKLALTPLAKGKNAVKTSETNKDSLMEVDTTPKKGNGKDVAGAETSLNNFSCSVDISGNSPK